MFNEKTFCLWHVFKKIALSKNNRQRGHLLNRRPRFDPSISNQMNFFFSRSWGGGKEPDKQLYDLTFHEFTEKILVVTSECKCKVRAKIYFPMDTSCVKEGWGDTNPVSEKRFNWWNQIEYWTKGHICVLDYSLFYWSPLGFGITDHCIGRLFKGSYRNSYGGTIFVLWVKRYPYQA